MQGPLCLGLDWGGPISFYIHIYIYVCVYIYIYIAYMTYPIYAIYMYIYVTGMKTGLEKR